MTLEEMLLTLLMKGKRIVVDDWIISQQAEDFLLVGRGVVRQSGSIVYPDGARVVLQIQQAVAIVVQHALGELA